MKKKLILLCVVAIFGTIMLTACSEKTTRAYPVGYLCDIPTIDLVYNSGTGGEAKDRPVVDLRGLPKDKVEKKLLKLYGIDKNDAASESELAAEAKFGERMDEQMANNTVPDLSGLSENEVRAALAEVGITHWDEDFAPTILMDEGVSATFAAEEISETTRYRAFVAQNGDLPSFRVAETGADVDELKAISERAIKYMIAAYPGAEIAPIASAAEYADWVNPLA